MGVALQKCTEVVMNDLRNMETLDEDDRPRI